MLESRRIVLGVTGSIAAYKAAELASRLTQAGALVDTILTRSALEFVTPLTFRSLTHRPVRTLMFNPEYEVGEEHVRLGEWAELVLIAPATANLIAKLVQGLADDLLTATVLATQAPVVVAPAMHSHMYQHPATQENLDRLRGRGITVVGPAYGRLASGAVGPGRLAETEEIIGTVRMVLGRQGDLAGRRVVVTAGGTQEPIDPVRHITNRSSGKMGYALAEAARDRGAQVTLISAPTALPAPAGLQLVGVRTAAQMREAVLSSLPEADALIMAAAVADYGVDAIAPHKIKKGSAALTLHLVPTPDILEEAAQMSRRRPEERPLITVGFAAESQELLPNARAKLEGKGVDLIVANDVSAPDSGFEVDTNRVTLLERGGAITPLPLLPKAEAAQRILDRVVALLAQQIPRPT